MTKESEQNLRVYKQRQGIVLLLFLCCIIALILLWRAEPPGHRQITSHAQLDSLIYTSFRDYHLPESQIRRRTVRLDSLFYRNVYTLQVAPDFSKTSLHYHLHHTLLPYNVQTMATVKFPERDVHIHILVNKKVHRTVIIRTNRELAPRPPAQNPSPHEMD